MDYFAFKSDSDLHHHDKDKCTINFYQICHGGRHDKNLGGGHRWNKFGSFGWRNIINGLGQAFLLDLGPRVVRPNREGVDFMQKIAKVQREFYFWSEKQAIKLKITKFNERFKIFKRKSIVLDKKNQDF